jgi:hypothetical protein
VAAAGTECYYCKFAHLSAHFYLHFSGEKVDPAVASSENATYMLNDLVNKLCARLTDDLEEGELSDAGETMLLILALMTCQRTGLSHAMQQVRRITYSSTVHVCAVRDAIRTLQKALQLLSVFVQQSPAVLNQLRGVALSVPELQQLTKIHSIYAALAPAVKQIRAMLLELLAVNVNSELQYLAPHLMGLLWQLFDPVTKANPLVSIDAPGFKDKGVASTVVLMTSCGHTLQRLCAVLHMVELTAGTESFISTIKQDLMSYKSFTHNAALGLSSLIGLRKNPVASTDDDTEDNIPIVHTHKELPKCLSDLIGYAAARTLYASHHHKRVLVGDYSEFTWKPASVSRLLRSQLMPEPRHHKGTAPARKKGTKPHDHVLDLKNTELGMEKLEHLWD